MGPSTTPTQLPIERKEVKTSRADRRAIERAMKKAKAPKKKVAVREQKLYVGEGFLKVWDEEVKPLIKSGAIKV